MSESNLVMCLGALRDCEPGLAAEDIIVVLDPGGADWTDANWHCRFLESDRAEITRCWNTGFRATTKPFFILCDDVQLKTRGGFTRMLEEAEADLSIGWLLPAMLGDRVPANHTPLGGPMLRRIPVGTAHCVLFPRHVYEKVGEYDERFAGYGMDDVDYSLRVQLAGYRVCIYEGCEVWHGGFESVARKIASFEEDHIKNWRRFIDKWGIKGISSEIEAYVNQMYNSRA